MIGNFLTWNGGGARTLLELDNGVLLHQILGNNFFTHFDIISGTSGGALITGMIACGYTPSFIKDVYIKELPNIFNSKLFRELCGKSKYDNSTLKSIANNFIGNKRLGDLKQKIMIPVVNSTNQESKIFKSWDDKDKDYLLVDVILASSSAPRYFPAVNINNKWYKDGGLTSNNPADILALETLNPDLGYTQAHILSITSGINKDVVTKAEQKGNLLSIPEMIDEMLVLQDKKSHGITQKLFEYGAVKGTYERCEAFIHYSSGEIDDVSKSNIQNMIKDANITMNKNKEKIVNFCKRTIVNNK